MPRASNVYVIKSFRRKRGIFISIVPDFSDKKQCVLNGYLQRVDGVGLGIVCTGMAKQFAKIVTKILPSAELTQKESITVDQTNRISSHLTDCGSFSLSTVKHRSHGNGNGNTCLCELA